MAEILCYTCNSRPAQIQAFVNSQRVDVCRSCYAKPKYSLVIAGLGLLTFGIVTILYTAFYLYQKNKWKQNYN